MPEITLGRKKALSSAAYAEERKLQAKRRKDRKRGK